MREEVRSLEMVRSKMAERIKELEFEVRELKEKVEEKVDDEVCPKRLSHFSLVFAIFIPIISWTSIYDI